MAGWVMARLVGGPAHNRLVRIFVDTEDPEIYRIVLHIWSPFDPITDERFYLGSLVAKYRYSRLSETEFDGSIPVMLFGYVRLEK